MNLEKYLIPAEESMDKYLDALESQMDDLLYQISLETAMEAEMNSDNDDDTSNIDRLSSSLRQDVSKLRSAANSGNTDAMNEARSNISREVSGLEAEGKKKMSPSRKRKLLIATGIIAAATAAVIAFQGGRKISSMNQHNKNAMNNSSYGNIKVHSNKIKENDQNTRYYASSNDNGGTVTLTPLYSNADKLKSIFKASFYNKS